MRVRDVEAEVARASDVIAWVRIGVLVVGLGIAAELDRRARRVPNEHWMGWSKPALFLIVLDLLLHGADLAVALTALAAVALASTSLIGTPTVRDLLRGSWLDALVLLIYVGGMTGLILGALTHGTHAMGSLFTAGADPMALLWWTWVLQILAIAFILLAYRVGLIYGGADAKALLWITLLLPGWRALPGNASCDLTCGLHLPPSLGLLLWTGLAFLMMPIGLTLLNLTRGAIRGTEDLRLAWHAVRRPIARASEGHVWVLTELMDHPDGTIIPHHRTRPEPRTHEATLDHIAALEAAGITEVWVTHKHPLLVFVLVAVPFYFLIGDPMALFERLVER